MRLLLVEDDSMIGDRVPVLILTARVDPSAAADAALTAAVKAALAADSRLKSFAIDIRAANGAVELFGTVDAKQSREKAEKLAAAVAGVKSVKNHLVLVSGS